MILVALALWWSRRSDRAPRPVAAEAKPTPRRTAPTSWAIKAPPAIATLEASRAVDRSKVGLWMLEDSKLPIVVAEALIHGRFPRWSHPLEAGMVDLLEPNGRAETCAALERPEGGYGDPALCVLFTGDKARVTGDQPLYVTFEVLRGKDRVAAAIVNARARQVEYLNRKPLGPEAPLALLDQGDHLYAATFRAAGTVFEDHFGYIHLEVDYRVDGEAFRSTLDVWNQPADQVPARFTPPFREALRDGSLTIYVGVTVMTAGSYVIDANLFDPAGAPVAYMHHVSDLPEGRSEVPLQVFGRVIREKAATGPFSLSNLRGFLFLLGKDPDRQLMPDFEGEYTTAPYQTTDFSDAEFWDQAKEDMVRHLQDTAATGSHGMTKATLEDAGEMGWTPSW